MVLFDVLYMMMYGTIRLWWRKHTRCLLCQLRMRSPTYYEGGSLLFLLSLWFFNDSLQIPAEDGAKEGDWVGVGFHLDGWPIKSASIYGLGRSPRVH